MVHSLFILQALFIANAFAIAIDRVKSDNGHAVPVELFVMSKCPDAVRCESTFDKVLKEVSVPFSLDINFIANPAPLEPLKFACMHGPSECYGNMQELCYKHVHGEETWLPFILCLNEERAKIGSDELAASCAREQGKPYSPVRDCLINGTAIELHARSVNRTATLGIHTSCTIHINGKHRCVHDGGNWRDCPGGSDVEDFVKTIEDAYSPYSSSDTSKPHFSVQSN